MANTDDAALAEAFRDSIPTETEADIEWAAYYKDPNITTKPTSQAPDWVPKDANGDPVGKTDTDLAQAYKDSLPAKGSAEYEQLSSAEKAWVNYYKDGADRPDTEPAWAANADKDDFDVPEGSSAKLEDPNATELDKAWAEYYLDQGDAKQLKKMSEEEAPIDLGMGLLRDDDGNLIQGTYYSRALPSILLPGRALR